MVYICSMETVKLISYIRVSTSKQGESGLGLESQKKAIQSYASSIGAEIIAEYCEVQSAGNKDKIQCGQEISIAKLLRKRPILQKTIDHAKQSGAKIVVKESSRLSRFSLLIDFIMTAGIGFVCADSPNDSEMIVKLKTLIAEDELKKISERTRRALAVKKDNGEPLGSRIKNQGFKKGHLGYGKSHKEEIALRNKQMLAYVHVLRESNLTWEEILGKVNSIGYKTRDGKVFNVPLLCRYYKKFFVVCIALAMLFGSGEKALDSFIESTHGCGRVAVILTF